LVTPVIDSAGATEAVLCPLERVQTLLQDSARHREFRNAPHAFLSISRQHGPTELYRGLSVVVLRNGLSNVVFFALRDPIREQLTPHLHSFKADTMTNVAETHSPLADFISGAVLGASISTLFFPLNVIKQRIQSRLGGAFESPRRVLAELWRQRNKSLAKLYRGVHLNFTRSLLTWGITNTIYELLRRKVLVW
jgi:Mitochondrial carrier protein